MPNVVAVGDRMVVRAGLSGRGEVRPEDSRAMFSRARALQDALQPACGGRADVVVAADDVDADLVLTTVAGLKRDCEQPTRVVIGADSGPVPLANVHFCGCRAAEPPRYCSAPELHLRSWRIETRRVTRFVGDETCTHGAAPFLRAGQSKDMPPRPSLDRRVHASVSSALDLLAQPHAGLPPCRDATVAFDGAWTWGQMRPILREVANRLPQRITVSRTVAPVYSSDAEPPASDPGALMLGAWPRPCAGGRPCALETPPRSVDRGRGVH